LGRIRQQYVETGKVRFAYKHLAILGPESNRTAEASECAAEQEQFWTYHDRIFEDQNSSRSTLSDDRLIELAADIGLDTTAFGQCLTSDRYTARVSQESSSVKALGVRGTPAFLINGVFVTGAQPFEVFEQILEEQLSRAQDKAELVE
jgi:protein-disulfide isomerase